MKIGSLITTILLILGWSINATSEPTVYVSDIGGVHIYDDANGDYFGRFGDTSGESLLGLVQHPVTGNLLAGHSDGYIVEYNGETGSLIGILGDSADQVVSPLILIFHPVTGNLLVLEEGSSFPTDILPVVQEYDSTTGNYIGDFGETKANLQRFVGYAMTFSQVTGNLLISDRDSVKEFDGITGQFLGIFGTTDTDTGTIVGLAINPANGNVFVADRANDDVREFDATTGAFIRSLDGDGTINNPISIAFAPLASSPSNVLKGATASKASKTHPVGEVLHIFHDGFGFRAEIKAIDIINGNFYDYSNSRIRSSAGGFIITLPSSTPTSQQSIGNSEQAGTVMHPVSTFTGELFEEPVIELSFGGPMPLIFSRYYASRLKTDGNIRSSLGDNWLHNFDSKLRQNGSSVTVVTNRGRVITFEHNGTNWALIGKIDIAFQLTDSGTDFVLLDPRTSLMYTFNIKGKLSRIEDGHGNAQTLLYSGDGVLVYISDNLGREMFFTYSLEFPSDFGPRKLIKVTDRGPARSINFTYTGNDLTSVTDVLGNITTFTYEPGSLMTASTRPNGNIPFSQSWNGVSQVTTQTNSAGDNYSLLYNGLTTTIINPQGNTRAHTHTASGELANSQDTAGLSVVIGSDTTGRRNSITDRLGDVTNMSYHAASGKLSVVTNADSTSSSRSYAARAFASVSFYDLTGVTHADATTESFIYDANGNLSLHTDRAGNTSSATYNGNGQPLTVSNVLGGIRTNTYNTDASLNTTTDPAGNTTNLGYDSLKRVNQLTFSDNNLRSMTYDDANNLLTTMDENGNTVTLSYDANGNLLTSRDPLLNTTIFAYDGNDRLLSITDPLAGVTSLNFDELDRVGTTTDPNGNVTTLDYDIHNRLNSITDPMLSVWTSTYDLEGIIASRTDPMNNTTTFISDTMGRITQTSSPLGNVSSVTYNTMGQVVTQTDALGQTTTLSRDTRDLLSGVTLPGGTISVTYQRNALGLITRVTDPSGNDWDSSFDNSGRQVASTDPLSNSQTMNYDNRNRLATVTYPGGLGSQELVYDPAGNLVSRSYSDGTLYNFSYDVNSRLTSADGVSLGYDANNRITNSNGITLVRDAGGRITNITLATAKALTYSYDANDRVTQIIDWDGGIITFSYDAAGRLTGTTRPNGINSTKSYDKDNRLTELTEGVISSISLTRDAGGQVTSADLSVPQAASVASLSNATHGFDAASQLTSASYDAMGRIISDGSNTYTWDLASRLASVTIAGETTIATYDAIGNRLSRTATGVTRSYTWNYALGLPSIVIEQLDGSDLRYYVHTPAGELIYSINATTNSRYFYHYDAMGNTLFVSDDGGSVVVSYAYSPFGRLIAKTGLLDNPFTWQGQSGIMDDSNGLYYVRARYYDANTARFISRDPINTTTPREINPYQYALNNPLRFVDVNGLEPNLEEGQSAIEQAESDLAVANADLLEATTAIDDTVAAIVDAKLALNAIPGSGFNYAANAAVLAAEDSLETALDNFTVVDAAQDAAQEALDSVVASHEEVRDFLFSFFNNETTGSGSTGSSRGGVNHATNPDIPLANRSVTREEFSEALARAALR